jgi:hypothetical protein
LGYVSAESNTTHLQVIVDEVSPFECRAAKEDRSFEMMDLNFTCAGMPSDSIFSKYAECQVDFKVIEEFSTFYIRCRDEPENSQNFNENAESFIWRAQKSESITISNSGPSGTLYTTNATLQVVTEGGPENGKATCYYDNIEFFETNSTYHTQKLSGLTKQDFEYTIECKDIANNKVYTTINFTIDIDLEAPEISGLTKDGPAIKIDFNEEAACEYSFEIFNEGEGTSTGTLTTTHFVQIDRQDKFYLICKDRYGNSEDIVIYTRTEIRPPA